MMKKKIGIIGYGQLGHQIETFINEEQGHDFVDFHYFDDISHGKGHNKAFPFKDFDKNRFKDFDFYIGLGYNYLPLRMDICNKLLQNKRILKSFIHKTSYINPSAKIGHGVLIYPMCNLDQDVIIEDGVIVNNSVTLSHDTFIDKCTFISPGATIAGRVKVGKFCFIGTGTLISNYVTIGNNVKIGIGSIVTKDIKENLCVIGNPMKILEKNFKLL